MIKGSSLYFSILNSPLCPAALTSSSELLFPTARRKRAVRELSSCSQSSGLQGAL